MHRIVLSNFFYFAHFVKATIKLEECGVTEQLSVLGQLRNSLPVYNDHLVLCVQLARSTDEVFFFLMLNLVLVDMRVLDKDPSWLFLVGVLVVFDLVRLRNDMELLLEVPLVVNYRLGVYKVDVNGWLAPGPRALKLLNFLHD